MVDINEVSEIEEVEVSKEIKAERDRIKKKFNEMLERVIKKRQCMKKMRSHHVIAISQIRELEEAFFFYIDNPNYIRNPNWMNDMKKAIKDRGVDND